LSYGDFKATNKQFFTAYHSLMIFSLVIGGISLGRKYYIMGIIFILLAFYFNKRVFGYIEIKEAYSIGIE